LLYSSSLSGQSVGSESKIDSLRIALKRENNDTQKIGINIDIANICHENSILPDTGLKYATQALELSEKIYWTRGIGFAYSCIAGNYCDLGNPQKALDYYKKALNTFLKISFENKVANWDERLLNNKQVLLQRQNDVANSYEDLATTYNILSVFDSGIFYSRLALNYYRDADSPALIAIGESSLAYAFLMKGMADSSIYYFKEIAEMAHKTGTKKEEIAAYNNIGETYKQMGKYRESLIYYFKAYKTVDSENISYAHIMLGNIGETYLQIAKTSKSFPKKDDLIPDSKSKCLKLSINNLKDGVKGAIKINDLRGAIEFSGYIADACKQSGNYREAFVYFTEYAELLDSLNKKIYATTLENVQEIHKREIEIKNKNLAVKEDEIAINKLELESKRKKEYLLATSTLFLLIIIALVYRNNRFQHRLNGMLREEKQKSENLLLNILPESVANELKASGTTQARFFPEVSIMFTDFKGFTQFSEVRSPKEIIDELNDCFNVFDEIVLKYNIEKIKTIGDSYMAVAGLNDQSGNHAIQAVMAAKEMNLFAAERRKSKGNNALEIRIGIHSGPVIAGVVGKMKFAYDVWGDSVNVAARIEQSCEPGMINISEATYQLVNEKFTCFYRGEIEAKNKGLLKMYYIN